ncbi:unnamed protein product [Sphagnum jensenii]|uniref:Uncharacterized protein n=1 Tax=Sphagnum jensenii TaxID=128206 RepID=A0ABP1BZX0_9BRYO
MRTRHLEYRDVRFYQQHIDTLGHVSETPSDWLTQNDHANAPEVSVSQKPTRGEIQFNAPGGRSRFHPPIFGRCSLLSCNFVLDGPDSIHARVHGRRYVETRTRVERNLWRLLRF